MINLNLNEFSMGKNDEDNENLKLQTVQEEDINNSKKSHSSLLPTLFHSQETTPTPTHTPTTTKKLKSSSSKNWDCNTLPKIGTSIIPKTHSFNIITLPINGESKQILYDPNYNKNFKNLHVFLLFNMMSNTNDSLVHSKKRISSYVNFLTKYLRTRQFAYQCYPMDLQISAVKETQFNDFEMFASGNDYTEIEMLLHLWYLQSFKFILQSNSLIFAPDVVDYLIKRKSNENFESISDNNDFNKLDSIDILLIRPLFASQIGLQIAYDKPSLNIAEYPLDISPWMANEIEAKTILDVHDQLPELQSSVKIVYDESNLTELNNETCSEFLLDCLDRKLSNIRQSNDNKDNNNNTSSNNDSPTNILSDHNGNNLMERELENKSDQLESTISSSQSEFPSKKGSVSSILNINHNHNHNHNHNLNPLLHHTRNSIASNNSTQHAQTIQNQWLEDYFSKTLSNYRKVDIPTQYILPTEFKNNINPMTTNQDKSNLKNAYLYGKNSLQLKLPFPDNSIPSIFCPWLWIGLAFDKWKNLLRELLRITTPGGYVLAIVGDIKISNSKSESKIDKDNQFPSTLERDRALEALSLAAVAKGLETFPTKYLVKAFKEVGFINVKYTALSFKTGDFQTDMGYMNDLLSVMNWDFLIRKYLHDPNVSLTDIDPSTLFERYVKEHMNKLDDDAGFARTILVVAQKSTIPQNTEH